MKTNLQLPQLFFFLLALVATTVIGQEPETFAPLQDGVAPRDFEQMWAGFDPRAEPLEVELLHEWEEEDVLLRVVRFRVGVFKGKKAKLAAVYGFPKSAVGGGKKLPGLVQIHGGGQYADHKACLMNAKRGYATVSLAWAGRISATNYRLGPNEVKLFWDGKTDDPKYKLTTDWGAVDGYHAPGRNAGNQFPSAKPASWTLDAVESPRNSGWFLCAVAARRALTFLERQPEVDADKLGVYGHSMGGKLTVLTAPDPRVKAAAPSCGGISDRDNASVLFQETLGDDVSLKQISCPIIFLSPANDFHGRIGDLPKAIDEIQGDDWRVTCSPHHNHQDTSSYEVATLLWFDQHLKGSFTTPKTPTSSLQLNTADGIPSFTVEADLSSPIASVDIFYTQHGKPNELSSDRDNTVHRFWRQAKARKSDGRWSGSLPLITTEKPLWVHANITYKLSKPVEGAGYYYGIYTARTFNLSTLLTTVTSEELQSAGVRATLKPTTLIESFEDDWQKEWFTYREKEWAQTTNKLYDAQYKPPQGAKLALDVQADEKNKLVILIDQHAAEVKLTGGGQWQSIVLEPNDFRDVTDESLVDWNGIKQLKLSAAERLRPGRGDDREPRIVGGNWQGKPPVFRNLRWTVDASIEKSDSSANTQTIRVTPDTDTKSIGKKVKAGDSIVLENGVWRDADLKFERLPGTGTAPIQIRAETPGQVVFTGRSLFRFSGTHVVVSGLVFRDMDGVSDPVQFRTHSQRLAHNCRLTDCVFEQSSESEAGIESRWLSLYGTNNRVDHCYFHGKRSRGTTLVVWVTEEIEGHRIDHNHFGPRPELGRNGGETIRIGTSDVSEFNSRTIVEGNYFHACNGEGEIISNKSCENVYRHNVFDSCSGALTLRHGHRCVVDGNVFYGNKQRGTGGVRIIGQNHVVTNNYFEGLRGDAERAAICMMNAVPNGPLNTYAPVREAVVSHNTFVDCKVSMELGVGASKEQSAVPTECRVTHNVFMPGKWPLFRVHSDPVSFVWNGNKHKTGRVHEGQLVEFERVEFEMKRTAYGLLRPTSTVGLKSSVESSIKRDIDGQQRGDQLVAGCDDPSTPLRTLASVDNTGPTWRSR